MSQASDPTRADPTRQANQPALTTSRGTIWLIVGGFSALAGLGVLVPMALAYLPPHPVAVVGAVIVALSYAGMVLTRFVTPPGRTRLTAMLVLMLVLVGVALVASGIVATAAAGTAT
jgi:hypothetical protein